MVDEEHLDDVFHVEKCSGIPMCPAEYHFDMDKPKTITNDKIKINEKKLISFLEKFGLNLI